MPIFYFHICDDDGAIPDQEGMDFINVEAALAEGEESARELLVQNMKEGLSLDHRRIEIRNSGGEVVGVFKLKDLVH